MQVQEFRRWHTACGGEKRSAAGSSFSSSSRREPWAAQMHYLTWLQTMRMPCCRAALKSAELLTCNKPRLWCDCEHHCIPFTALSVLWQRRSPRRSGACAARAERNSRGTTQQCGCRRRQIGGSLRFHSARCPCTPLRASLQMLQAFKWAQLFRTRTRICGAAGARHRPQRAAQAFSLMSR